MWPCLIAHASIVKNRRSHASLNGRSPLDIWPSAPWQYPALLDHPIGCRMFSSELNRTDRSSAAGRRSRPLVYLGFSKIGRHYHAYDVETNTVISVGYKLAKFVDTVFPLRDMMIVGERVSSDSAIDVDGWQSIAVRSLSDDKVSDVQLSEYFTGKQIVLRVPTSVFPKESGQVVGEWMLRATRPVRTRDGVRKLEFAFVRLLGNHSLLPHNMQDYRCQT